MKATDLMIGDWVLINNTLHKIQAIDGIGAEIQADDELYYVGEDRYRLEDRLEGAPLTYELLKKNGWYWGLTSDEDDFVKCARGVVDSHWVYDEGVEDISLIFPEDTYIGSLKIDDKRFNRYIEFFWSDTLYVHELQHALRLYGLNDLANNFKI